MKELCKTYFEIDGKIINGYKVVEENGSYNIYVYTSCKKLGNWQLLSRYNSLDNLICYFKKLVKRDEIEHQTQTDWVIIENQWRRNTLEILLNVLLLEKTHKITSTELIYNFISYDNEYRIYKDIFFDGTYSFYVKDWLAQKYIFAKTIIELVQKIKQHEIFADTDFCELDKLVIQ